MRISIVQGAFFPVPPIEGGAVEKVWWSLGQEFARRGHQVLHISRCNPQLANRESVEGVQHVRVAGFSAPKSLLWLKCLDLVYSLRALRELPQADILVTNTFWLPILVRSERLGKVYVHVARYPRGQMRLYAHAARLQTVSHPIAEAICAEVPHLRDKVRSIPYPCPAQTREISASAKGCAKHLLYVGRIHPEKGIHLLIEAMTRLPQPETAGWKLLVVGPEEVNAGGGGADYSRLLRRLAKPVADHVEWVGPVFEPERLAQFYRSAALFVYPSLAERGETFGLAPLEAMSYGCPPLVSDLPCFRDFVVDRENGFVFPHRAENPAQVLATKITDLLMEPKHLANAGKRAASTAARYAPDRIAQLYLEDFQSLL